MEDCRVFGELTSLDGRRRTQCAAYLNSTEMCWVLKSYQHKISALCLLGAEIVPNRKTDFDVHSYNPTLCKFEFHSFRCESYDKASNWVMEIEALAFPEATPRNIAILLNPISGSKSGMKIFNKLMLPKLKLTPTSHSLFGEM